MYKMGLFDKLEIPGVRKVVVIASGKGGVGKSMVAANLAVAMARQGKKVALVDADIYGPSIPRMFGVEDAKPDVTRFGEQELMFPVEKYGVKLMSVGFFVDIHKGLIWRGPMASNAIKQLFEKTQWGHIDCMVVDFPPGTGDIQLTTIQKLDIAGAILVTTPQEIAVNDARKAASMFLNPDLGIPILGVVENMSWFTPTAHPDEKYLIFGQGGGERLASELNTRLLAQIPLMLEIGEIADKGLNPSEQPESAFTGVFEKIAEQLL